MTSFASIIDTLNSGSLALLGNCSVAWTGGSCTGLFESGHVETLGMINSESSVLVRSADIAALTSTAAITLDSVAYTQRERRPDGDGMTRIVVEAA